MPGVARAPVLASGNLYKKPETFETLFNFIDWPPEEAARAKKKKNTKYTRRHKGSSEFFFSCLEIN